MCVCMCVVCGISVFVCGYLAVKASRKIGGGCTWIGAEEEFYLRCGITVTFCIMTIGSSRDVETADVINMGAI